MLLLGAIRDDCGGGYMLVRVFLTEIGHQHLKFVSNICRQQQSNLKISMQIGRKIKTTMIQFQKLP